MQEQKTGETYVDLPATRRAIRVAEEQGTGTAQTEVPATRRAIREAAGQVGHPRRGRTQGARSSHGSLVPPRLRWLPKGAALASLALATWTIPVAAGAGTDVGDTFLTVDDGAAAEAVRVGPSASSVLGTVPEDAPPPASLAQAVPAEDRTAIAASRSASERAELTASGCDISIMPTGTNGQLSAEGLCELWGTGKVDRSDAADALTALNEAYVARYGKNMCIASAYRTLSEQYSVKSARGGLAATPGTSNHGWGLAVDFCAETYAPASQDAWLHENAPLFGWHHPDWARPGGSGPTEAWHWEFKAGVDALN